VHSWRTAKNENVGRSCRLRALCRPSHGSYLGGSLSSGAGSEGRPTLAASGVYVY
jgi:hypothetical protein